MGSLAADGTSYAELPSDVEVKPTAGKWHARLLGVGILAALMTAGTFVIRFERGQPFLPHLQDDPVGPEMLDATPVGIPNMLNATPVEMYDNGFLAQLLMRFPREDVAHNLAYSNCNANVPDLFKGLWWLDALITPEVVAGYGEGTWHAGPDACRESTVFFRTTDQKKRGVVVGPHGEEVTCQGYMSLPWIDAGWAMEDGVVGIGSSLGSVSHIMVAQFVCGGPTEHDLTVCMIGTTVPYPLKFFMVKATGDYWIRYTPYGVGMNLYYAKRITDCKGDPVPRYWQEFNSEGTAKPVAIKDVFGHGDDARSHVKKVGKLLIVREVSDCPKSTGGSCHAIGCDSSRNSFCQHGDCYCGDSRCAKDGKCEAQPGTCPKLTSGTCGVVGCDKSRGDTVCVNGFCLCAPGTCSIGSRCSSHASAPGSCSWQLLLASVCVLLAMQ